MSRDSGHTLWITDARPGAIKIFGGHWIQKQGLISADGQHVDGLFEKRTLRAMRAAVDYHFPFFPVWYRQNMAPTRQGTMEDAIAHRARHAVRGHELLRFERPIWQPFRNLAMEAVFDGRVVTLEDLYQALEHDLKTDVAGEPGVYIRCNPADPSTIYVGKSKDLARRGARSESADRMVACFVTQNSEAAASLETAIHTILAPSRLAADRPSMFRVHGRDAAEVAVREVINSPLRFFLRRYRWMGHNS